jgi:nicotinamide-nucleotide amidase
MQINKNYNSVTKTIDTTAEGVVKYMVKSGKSLCTAESCTGGMVSEKITSVAGASKMFLGGVCSYTEQIKQKILGVKKDTLDRYTVYSPQVASEMSRGALELFGADVAVGITGIAGPSGGTAQQPVGTVYIGFDICGRQFVKLPKLWELHDTSRENIRRSAAAFAFETIYKEISNGGQQ